MIYSLSNKITEALCKAQVVAESDRELYVYGFFILLSQIIFFFISAFFGLVLGTLWESIAFYIMFTTLRSYAGGFHASKESVCTCSTTLALFLASLSIRILGNVKSVIIPLNLLVLGSTVVYLLSPLDSEDKPLSFDEFRDYRKKSIMASVAIVIIAISGVLLQISGILYAAATSITLESALLILGKVKSVLDYHN